MPGGDRLMVNVGTGNLVVQSEDMNVPHKGVALAFRRTYNSQSGHDVNGTDGGPAGLYGNGWTNTFDAHIVRASEGHDSVYDIDGARYDYEYNSGGISSGFHSVTPGQHAILAWDGACGLTWTKKSGTIYYFYVANPSVSCPAMASVGGYAGRLHQIIGRNHKTYITLDYSWDNGDASTSGTISGITATTESGLSATLGFGPDPRGHRVLLTLTGPGGLAVSYTYGPFGNLKTVTLPAYNAAETPVVKGYGYSPWPGGNPAGTMAWAASPRWMGLNGTDGEYLLFGSTFSGSDNAHASLSQIDHIGYIDPTPGDQTNTPIQPAPVTNSSNAPFFSEYYSLGTLGTPTSATFRDADGHYENWITDAAGRVTQAQLCTETVNQQCTVAPLVTGQNWDADNNLTAEIDPRGYETDYHYDLNGNAVAIGAPSTKTSAGTFRPTKLFDYDEYNNVIAYCDEVATHAMNSDFTNTPTTSDSLCTSRAGSVPYTRSTYVDQGDEPYRELSSITTPLGYTRSFVYPSPQSGLDYGLPTAEIGASFVQTDTTAFQEHKTFGYDAHGNLLTYGTGAGTWSLAYDSRNRLISSTDPDNVTTNTCYNSNGSVRAKQTALQYKMDGTVCGPNSTAYEYDRDGNQTSETHHYGNGAGTTQKWYDGAGRLVEVMQPREPDSAAALGADYSLPRRDNWTFAWMTRYLYDIAIPNSAYGSGGRAHGGLFARQEYTYLNGGSTAAWQMLSRYRYDAADRTIDETDLGAAYSGHGASSSKWNVYDEGGQLGLKTTSGIAATYERERFGYDERGLLVSESFTDDTGVQGATPGKSYTYDPVGRVATITSNSTGSMFGSMSYAYDVDGNLLSRTEANGSYDDAASTIGYSFYPNGKRRGLSVAAQSAGGFTQPDLFTYSYRSDGLLQTKQVNLPSNLAVPDGSGRFTWSYSAAGRLNEKDDPFVGVPIPGVQSSAALRANDADRAVPGAHVPLSIAPMVEAVKKSQADPLAAPYSHHANGKQPIPVSAVQGGAAQKPLVPNVTCPQARPGMTSIVPNLVCCSTDCPTPAPRPSGPPTPPPTPMPTPQARPFSGLKITYDSQGQISGYQLPSGGTYNRFTYDAEGSVTDYYGFGGIPGDGGHPAKHVNNEYNVRGEVTGQHVFDGTATGSYSGDWPSFAVIPVNGTMAPYRDQNPDSTWQSFNGMIDNWNTFSGKWTQQTQNISYNTYYGVACKRIGSQFTWTQDASGRDVGIHVAQIQSFPPDCSNPAYMGGDVTRSYDFRDRLVQWRFASGNFWPGASEGLQCSPPTNNGLPSLSQGYMGARNYGWGPEDKLVQTNDGGGPHALHWDGDELLFVTNGQGGIEDLKLSSDASVAHGKFIVIDRDWSGMTVQGHDASGYGPWVPLSPFQQACRPNSPPPASPGFDNPAGVTIVQRALDGYYDGLNVFQGVRTYDPQTTQWTTPDVYAGEINDPMSQKPYMWNRNDSFRYMDPSGFDGFRINFNLGGAAGGSAAGGAAAAAGKSLLNVPMKSYAEREAEYFADLYKVPEWAPRFPTQAAQLKHIFNDKHELLDSPGTRAWIQKISSMQEWYVGTKQYGNFFTLRFWKPLPDGRGLWIETTRGVIKDAWIGVQRAGLTPQSTGPGGIP